MNYLREHEMYPLQYEGPIRIANATNAYLDLDCFVDKVFVENVARVTISRPTVSTQSHLD